jgi:ATP-binding cassette subfamily C protein LapB
MSTQDSSARISGSALRKLLSLQHALYDLSAVNDALVKSGAPTFGVPATQLPAIEAAIRLLGIRGAQVAKTKGQNLLAKHLPVLIEHKGNCWLLNELRDNYVLLETGSGETLEVPKADIEEAAVIWIALPAKEHIKSAKGNPAKELLLRTLLSKKRILIEVAIATFMTSMLTMATSMFAQQVYDRVIPTFAYATLWALGGLVFVLLLFDFFLRVTRAKMLDRVSRELDEEISYELFKSLSDVRLDARPKAVGSLAAQISGLDSARAFFTSGVLFTLAEVPFALLFMVVINIIAGPLVWVYVMAAIVAVCMGLWAQMHVRKMTQQTIQSGYQRNGLLVEAIAGGETIKALGAGWRFADHWRVTTERISNSALRSRQASAVASALAINLSTAAYISVIVFGVQQIEAGALTVGGLIATTILGGRIIGPISSAMNLLTQAQTATQSLSAIDTVLSLPKEREPGATTITPIDLGRQIQLEAVQFFYGEAPVPNLDIPKLSFEPGDRVVLVGPPGCGKSTLLRVLAGLYKPGSGRVLIGDIDLSMLDSEKVRSLVGLMPQEIQLFNGTLRDNLQIGGAVDDARLMSVVRLLGLDSLVADHPKGIDRPISEGGYGLSVGQRQLCGVARLLLRRPRVWLMDEPTSALDHQSERRMYETLNQQIAPEDILIVATHRPSAVPFCERVLMMQRGRIVADGNRDQIQERVRSQVQRLKGGAA